jgi:capsular exopolysaccharide synthesis family protein
VHEVGPPDLDEALLQPEGSENGEPFPEAVNSQYSTTMISISETGSEPEVEPPIHAVEPSTPRVRDMAAKATPAPRPEEPSVTPAPLEQPIVSAPAVDSAVFRSPVHAAYERIIQRLLKFRGTPRQSVILVTSAIAGEGTSTVARNTALALGRRETEQVLLIDANFRTPIQHSEFGIARENGLSDVLMGATTVISAIEKDDVSEISIMTAGSKVPSPSQLLSSAGLQGVVMAVLSLYDWVIIDAPPTTSYPDASSIATACGGAILVIEAESTRSEVIEETKRTLQETGVDLLGAVLNRRKYHIPGFIYRRL